MTGFGNLLRGDFVCNSKADLSMFNSIGVVNEPPMLWGQINPEYEEDAQKAENRMVQAEHDQRIDDESVAMSKSIAEEDFSEEELNRYNAGNKKVFDRNKARYQGGKGQWQMSGTDMDAKSYVKGFDDLPEEDTVII